MPVSKVKVFCYMPSRHRQVTEMLGRGVVSATPQPFYPPTSVLRYTLNDRLGGSGDGMAYQRGKQSVTVARN
jgi:hypothetical protein